MDTKQKHRDAAGKSGTQRPQATRSRPDRGQHRDSEVPRQRSAASAKAVRRPADQTRKREPERSDSTQLKRRPPQGASVYGASSGGRPRGDTSRTVTKKPQEPSALQKLLHTGAAVSRSAGASRERVRNAQKQMTQQRKKKRRQKYDTPAVIYTDPKPFNRGKLLMQLMTVAAVVIALVLGLSVFFKVETITVSGAQTYSAWAVREASGISEGDNLLTFSRARAGAQIRASLSYVDKVRIGIKLPDTVNIYIEELDVAYAIQDKDGIWWLMTSEGRIVQQSDSSSAEQYTQVLGVRLDSPVVNQYAVAVEEAPATMQETNEAGVTVETVAPVTVTGAQRLSAALEILKALEANDIVGEAASVDVSSVNSIELWYGQRYQVNLGDTTQMEYKITCMNDVILELEDYQTGMLDISFTTWADQVGYTPFA